MMRFWRILCAWFGGTDSGTRRIPNRSRTFETLEPLVPLAAYSPGSYVDDSTLDRAGDWFTHSAARSE
jgi:hypothetical protein